VPPTEVPVPPEDWRVTLQAESPDAFDAFSADTVEVLEEAGREVLEGHIVNLQERIELLVARSQAKIDFLASQVAEPTATTPANADTLTKLLQFQQQQSILAAEFSELAGHKFDQAAIARAQSNVAELIDITVVSEVDTPLSNSSTTRLVLAAISGVMLGIFVGLLVDQLPNLKKLLSDS